MSYSPPANNAADFPSTSDVPPNLTYNPPANNAVDFPGYSLGPNANFYALIALVSLLIFILPIPVVL